MALYVRRRVVLVLAGLLFILTAAAPRAVMAQDGMTPEQILALLDRGSGYTPMKPEDAAQLPLTPLTRAYIPEAIDLSDRFPTPGSQGAIGSCLSWATAYSVRSYYAAIETGSGNIDDKSNIASPAYLHNWLHKLVRRPQPVTCDAAGNDWPEAHKFLQLFGAQSFADYPESKFCTPIQDASPTPVSRFRMEKLLFVSEYPAGERGPGRTRVNLDRVKLALKAGNPVLVGMWLPAEFSSWSSNAVFNGRSSEGKRPHAMVIAGYDDRRRAFRILNSWGTRWADGGYAWMDYDAAVHNTMEMVVMIPPGVTPVPASPNRPIRRPAFATPNDCSETGIATEGNRLIVTGFVDSQATEDSVRTRIMRVADEISAKGKEKVSVDWKVDLRPWPICEAMITLREPLYRTGKPSIVLDGGERVLKVGERFSFKVTTPDVPSFVYVIYIEDDGTVVNLSPRRGLLRAQHEPKTVLPFGDGEQGRPTFKVTPPRGVDAEGNVRKPGDVERGHEAVIVVTARAPIDELEALEGPDSPVFGRKAAEAKVSSTGPPDRLYLSRLRDIVLQRAKPDTLPREVTAAILHLKITD